MNINLHDIKECYAAKHCINPMVRLKVFSQDHILPSLRVTSLLLEGAKL